MDEETALTHRNTRLNSISVIKPILSVYLIIVIIYFAVLVYSIIDLINLMPIYDSYIVDSLTIRASSTFWYLLGISFLAKGIFGDVWMFLLLSITVLNFLLNRYHLLKNQEKGLLVPNDHSTSSRYTILDMVSVFIFCFFVYTLLIIHELKHSYSDELVEKIVFWSIFVVIPSCISIVTLPRAIKRPRFIHLLPLGYQVFFIGLIGSNMLFINPGI